MPKEGEDTTTHSDIWYHEGEMSMIDEDEKTTAIVHSVLIKNKQPLPIIEIKNGNKK